VDEDVRLFLELKKAWDIEVLASKGRLDPGARRQDEGKTIWPGQEQQWSFKGFLINRERIKTMSFQKV